MKGYGAYTKSGRPFFVFDDIYEDDEVNRIFGEIDLCIRPLMRRDNTGGTAKKSTNAIFLNEVFAQWEASNIFKSSRKLIKQEVMEQLGDFHWAFKAMRDKPVSEGIQVLYYEDSDRYGQHEDITNMTALTWFAREPQGFEGGDIKLDDDVLVPFKNNRAVFMSIGMPHEVIPVKSTTDKPGFGRYCISHFYNYASPDQVGGT
jgi:hypothetical protein